MPPKTVMVTGANGFIGRNLVARLRATGGARVIAVRHRMSALAPRDAATVAADLAGAQAAHALIGEFRPDLIVHAAGRNKGGDTDIWRDNALTARSLLDAAEDAPTRPHVILLGSAAEYGPQPRGPITETAPCRPVTSYGRAKLAATEDALQRASRGKIDVAVLRPFNVVGPGIGGELVLGAFIEKLKHASAHKPGEITIAMGRLDAVRDFVPLGHLLAVIQAAAARRISGEIINVCSGRGRAVRDILERLAVLAGLRVRIIGDAPVEIDPGPDIIIGDPRKCERLTGCRPDHNLDRPLSAAWACALSAQAKGVA